MQPFRIPDEPGTPPRLSPGSLPRTEQLPAVEVSMVEAADVTGVTFSPEHWALDVLRKEGVRSVLDIGCGPGAMLETLVQPASTVCEPPLREGATGPAHGSPDEPTDDGEGAEDSELFISRLAGLDCNPNVLPSALSILSPPSPHPAFPPPSPRWEPLHTELYLGGIEKYNSRLEGYDAIVALEVIEHLDPNVLSRFGVVTMGTYRPRLLLVSTPNFDFNAKFPRHDHDHDDFAHRGFVDPTGRTERVFRHSDHKLEMTSVEFREWAISAAEDWGYRVEVSGVGISSSPSYYPADHPTPHAPIYASQVALFRLGSGVPARSPRSVRSTELPWLSKEDNHPHKLVGRFTHPTTAVAQQGPLQAVQARVKEVMGAWNVGDVSLGELWGDKTVAGVAGGSRRYLVACLGGWGDQPALQGAGTAFEVRKEGAGWIVRWTEWKARDQQGDREEWGHMAQRDPPTAATGGW